MYQQRHAAVMTHRGTGWTAKTDRTYSRRDAVLLGATAVFGLAGAAMARSVFVDLTSPTTVAALPLQPATAATPELGPIDVTPRDLTTQILTEVPLTGTARDAIAGEAARFSPFGAGSVATVRKSWRPADGSYGGVDTGRIDLAETLFADDPWSVARREIELPALFARSAFVNLAPRNDNGAQLRALGDYLTTFAALRPFAGQDEALAVLNPYSYVDAGLKNEDDWGRTQAAMDDPAMLFAAVTTTWLRFPEELTAAVAAMEDRTESPTLNPASEDYGSIVASTPQALAKGYAQAVANLLVALVSNSDGQGKGNVMTQLDRAIPRFTLTRSDLGIGGS